jgi:hypothetical protein
VEEDAVVLKPGEGGRAQEVDPLKKAQIKGVKVGKTCHTRSKARAGQTKAQP